MMYSHCIVQSEISQICHVQYTSGLIEFEWLNIGSAKIPNGRTKQATGVEDLRRNGLYFVDPDGPLIGQRPIRKEFAPLQHVTSRE